MVSLSRNPSALDHQDIQLALANLQDHGNRRALHQRPQQLAAGPVPGEPGFNQLQERYRHVSRWQNKALDLAIVTGRLQVALWKMGLATKLLRRE